MGRLWSPHRPPRRPHLARRLPRPLGLGRPRRRGAPPGDDLVALRALLRRLVDDLAAGLPPTSADLAALDALLARPARRGIVPDGDGLRLALLPLDPGWPWLLAEIAASAADLLAAAPRRRLKVCPNPGCRWDFWDETNGNTRRWCNDRTCGNRDKVRRFRHRRATRAPRPTAG